MTELSPTQPIVSPAAPAPSAPLQSAAAAPAVAAEQRPASPAPSPSPAPPPASGAKPAPEGFDARFWDETTGQVKFKELAGHMTALSALEAERAAVKAAIPEKLEDYKLELPADFKMPEGREFQIDEKDPAVGVARQWAKDNGLTPEQFKNLIGLRQQIEFATEDHMKKLYGEQMQKLGPSSGNRIDAAQNWLLARGATDLAKGLYTAAQIENVEALMRQFSGAGVPTLSRTGAEQPTAGISDEDYGRMSPAERVIAARKHNEAAAAARR